MEEESHVTSSPIESSVRCSTFSETLPELIIEEVEHDDTVPLRAGLVKDSFEFLNHIRAVFNSEGCTCIQKLQILTLMPETWSATNIMKHFDTNRRMIETAREIQNENRILTMPTPKIGLFSQNRI